MLVRRVSVVLLVVSFLLAGWFLFSYDGQADEGITFTSDGHSEYQDGCLFLSEIAWGAEAPSPADEWYEIYNACLGPVSTVGWYLQTIQGDGDTVTATLPITTIPAGEVALFERSDDNTVSSVVADGIHGGSDPNAGSSLVGVFLNSEMVSFSLYGPDAAVQYHIIEMDTETLDWPAGSSGRNASMQGLEFGVWYTSNHGVETDAEGGIIYGTPGSHNEPNVTDPDACTDWVLPEDWDYTVDILEFEDGSFRFYVLLTAELYGIDPDSGDIITTEGETDVNFFFPSGSGLEGWVGGEVRVDEGTTEDCIDALMMLRDATEAHLRDNPSSVELPQQYKNWLDFIEDVQKSGLFTTNLPLVVGGE